MKFNPLLFLLPLVLVMVIVITVQVANQNNRPQSLIVRITGPTVISTQIVPLH